MARTQKFQTEQMLEATRALAVQFGPAAVTIGKIAAALGAPTGSIYHRFSSRDELLGQVWLNTAARYQADYHALLLGNDALTAAVASVQFVLDRARRDPDESRLLMLHRREDFLDQAWPTAMQEAARRLDAEARQCFRDFAARLLPTERINRDTLSGLRYALIDLPLAAIVPALRRGVLPAPEQDPLVLAAVRAVLAAMGVNEQTVADSSKAKAPARKTNTPRNQEQPPRPKRATTRRP